VISPKSAFWVELSYQPSLLIADQKINLEQHIVGGLETHHALLAVCESGDQVLALDGKIRGFEAFLGCLP
jgi:hypothetical protein